LQQACVEYAIRNILLIGSPSAEKAILLSLKQAYQILVDSEQSFNLGEVTIAERHNSKGNKHLKVLQKSFDGYRFFIIQAVYNADATIDLLQQYAALCQKNNTQPNRVILTFTPYGSQKTLDFKLWLGISTANAIKTRILNEDDPLQESLFIDEENLQKIITYSQNLNIPLGLNIKSLTKHKEEIDASIKLFKFFKLLKATLDLNLAKHV
jgi:hypothetical protein